MLQQTAGVDSTRMGQPGGKSLWFLGLGKIDTLASKLQALTTMSTTLQTSVYQGELC